MTKKEISKARSCVNCRWMSEIHIEYDDPCNSVDDEVGLSDEETAERCYAYERMSF